MEETAPTKPYFREENMSKAVIGHVLVMASVLIYFTTEQFWQRESSEDYLSVFAVHYFIAIVFLVMLFYSGE